MSALRDRIASSLRLKSHNGVVFLYVDRFRELQFCVAIRKPDSWRRSAPIKSDR